MTTSSLLLRRVRRVPLDAGGPADVVDLRVRDGVLTDVAPGLPADRGERVVDADGRWAVPGLWDAHVHLQQWTRTLQRLDVSGTGSPEEVTARVAARLAAGPVPRLLVGFGQRTATWPRTATVAELDAVCGEQPVVLVSADAHHGWMSSAALRMFGLEPSPGPVEEMPWFAVLSRLEEQEGATGPALLTAVQDAAARGVVGVVDMEWETGRLAWPDRVAAGVDLLRVRPATYADGFDDLLATGLRTGDPLPGGRGLLTAGPLKVIFDGSLNTRTAYCCAPYPGGAAGGRGVLNLGLDELTALCRRAHAAGLEVAVHAIGDAAGTLALDALEASGARGSLEHVQLVATGDLPRFGRLGVRASVQPAHLLDDRDVTVALWADRQERSFALRSLADAGAELALGSDAPVARLDPWLAMAAAVHRSADDRPAWVPEEALTPREALAASTDGQRLRPGARGDVVLLEDDPLAPEPDTAAAARRLRGVRVAATYLGGRETYRA
ncbi:MAG: hypothetical protein JWO60_2529 [Frankiales bacterium]|nr:hypothetical protein [Frankiales bacterium]